jgi:hypothetical protein
MRLLPSWKTLCHMKVPSLFDSLIRSLFCMLLLCGAASSQTPEKPLPGQPRMVNIYNFIRNSDYRVKDSEEVLYETTRKQIEVLKPTGLPATWALQYDALINPKYQKLLKEQLGERDEIAAWWEVPRQMAEKAGLKWRGHDHDWDSTANVGFSPGYPPTDRRKLVDVYMAEFKSVFGYYPKTVGSWFIDEVTLEYMVKKYGIVASCNCKDQVGTDGYTLWGGYWNQAYYPSKLNTYMPAQTQKGQIDVPVFRMLGSDPIYQYGRVHGMFTLEPVYPVAGGSSAWVEWFMRNLIRQPSLAFAYTQAGQENSFGWDGMKTGFILQTELLEKQSKAGEIQVMTLAESGKWFKSNYPVTPPTSMVALDDWKNEERRTVWYNSRFYRMNLLWERDGFFIRDVHRFDEKVVSVTHDCALTTTALAYGTLPVMDGSLWSDKGRAGIWPVAVSQDGSVSPLVAEGEPKVSELNKTDLGVRQPLQGGGDFVMICREAAFICKVTDGTGRAVVWALEMTGGDPMKSVVRKVKSGSVSYRSEGTDYEVEAAPNAGEFQQLENGDIRISSGTAGTITLIMGKP